MTIPDRVATGLSSSNVTAKCFYSVSTQRGGYSRLAAAAATTMRIGYLFSFVIVFVVVGASTSRALREGWAQAKLRAEGTCSSSSARKVARGRGQNDCAFLLSNLIFFPGASQNLLSLLFRRVRDTRFVGCSRDKKRSRRKRGRGIAST
jgi:hypothetical protein